VMPRSTSSESSRDGDGRETWTVGWLTVSPSQDKEDIRDTA
jgi:hypothetical protein